MEARQTRGHCGGPEFLIMRLECGEIAFARSSILEAARRCWRIVFHCRLLAEMLRRREDNFEQFLRALALRFPIRRRPFSVDGSDLLAEELDRVRLDADLITRGS